MVSIIVSSTSALANEERLVNATATMQAERFCSSRRVTINEIRSIVRDEKARN